MADLLITPNLLLKNLWHWPLWPDLEFFPNKSDCFNNNILLRSLTPQISDHNYFFRINFETRIWIIFCRVKTFEMINQLLLQMERMTCDVTWAIMVLVTATETVTRTTPRRVSPSLPANQRSGPWQRWPSARLRLLTVNIGTILASTATLPDNILLWLQQLSGTHVYTCLFHPITCLVFRSNMFGMGRQQEQYPQHSSTCISGSGDSKLLPSIQSVGVSSGGEQLSTETPPQTPPNSIKMTGGLHMSSSGEVNQPVASTGYHPHVQQQPQSMLPGYTSQYSHSLHSYEAEDKSMVQYNDSINNIYNGTNSRI